MPQYKIVDHFPEADSQTQWPYKDLLVGHTVIITDPNMIKRGQAYAHTFGQKAKKKFRTRRTPEALYVQRVA